MIVRRSIVGLSLLSALVLCALTAQSASAAFTTDNNSTLFTCVKGGTQDFTDEHCDKPTTPPNGEFGHVAIAAGPTAITGTNAKTASSTTASTNAVLKGEAFEAESEVTATGVAITGTVENSGTGTTHNFGGTVTAIYSGTTVNKPKNCKIKGGSITVTSKVSAVSQGEEMGLKFEPTVVGGNFASFEMENNGGACVLAGKALNVKGSAIATGGAGNKAKGSGATAIFEAGNGMESLTFAGNAATFTSTVTNNMKEGGPIAITTFT